MSKLIGGPDLRARLASLQDVPVEFPGQWADDTRKRILATKPPSREAASSQFTTRVGRARAAVYGAFWWIFIDRGTKGHPITIRNKQVLSNQQTIFGTTVFHKRTRRRPFITEAAKAALAGSNFADLVVKQWNRRRGGHGAFL